MVILDRIRDQIIRPKQDKDDEGFGKKALPIRDYLDEELISFLSVQSRDEALETMLKILVEKKDLEHSKAFYEAVCQRESVVSTGIGMGVAIPHAKLNEYKDFFILIGIQKENGVDWEALDGAPVQLIFLIGGPSKRQGEYLEILSKLTAVIKHDDWRQKILQAETPQDVLKIFEDC
ncbi:MAG: PTS sugar transporter subunit IIA [Simkaniaceae bacterium]